MKNNFLDIKGKIFNKWIFRNISLNENKKKQVNNDYSNAFYILDKIIIIIIIIYLKFYIWDISDEFYIFEIISSQCDI